VLSDRSELGIWQAAQVVTVLLVLGMFLFQSQAILNPVVLFVLLWAVLLPFRGRPGHAVLLSVAAVLTLVWILSTTGSLLAPFVLALLLAYMLDPAADALEARGLSRTLAVTLIVVPAAVILGLAAVFLLPLAIRNVGQWVGDIPVLFTRLAEWIEQVQGRSAVLDVPLVELESLIERLRAIDSEAIVTFLQERHAALASGIWNSVIGVGRGLGAVLTILGYVALTPILAFYLLRDFDRVMGVFRDLVPHDARPSLESFVSECDRMVSRYLRGQVTVAVINGVVTGVGLAIVSFPYAATLGLLVTIFAVIPYLGIVISVIPAIVLALVSGNVVASLLKVAVVYGVAQLLDATVVTPRVVGESVGIHPVTVVLALSLGGAFFGFAGLLLGVPAAAIFKLLLLRGIDRYQRSPFYLGKAAASEP
jgi:predicted PurR-regulated permease PerM